MGGMRVRGKGRESREGQSQIMNGRDVAIDVGERKLKE